MINQPHNSISLEQLHYGCFSGLFGKCVGFPLHAYLLEVGQIEIVDIFGQVLIWCIDVGFGFTTNFSIFLFALFSILSTSAFSQIVLIAENIYVNVIASIYHYR